MTEQFNEIFFKKLAHIFDKYKNKDDSYDEGIDIINCNSSELDEMYSVNKGKRGGKRESDTKTNISVDEYEFVQDYEDMCFSRVERRVDVVVVKEKESNFDRLYEKACVNDFDAVFGSVLKNGGYL